MLIDEPQLCDLEHALAPAGHPVTELMAATAAADNRDSEVRGYVYGFASFLSAFAVRRDCAARETRR